MAGIFLATIEDLRPELSSKQLPVEKAYESFRNALAQHDSVMLSAPPGSGKSLDVGAWLLKIMGQKAKVAMTQPRRDAAENVAVATAARHGLRFGSDVCFATSEFRGNRPETRLQIMTTAILVNSFRNDPTLKNLDAVVVDEAHERDLHIDLALALLKRANNLRKQQNQPALKLVLVSATLEDKKFSRAFNISDDAKIRAEGRLYKVDRIFTPSNDLFIPDYVTKEPRRREVEDVATDKVLNILKNSQGGDILIFMPGIRRIQNTQAQLERMINKEMPGAKVDIRILHSSVSQRDRSEVLKSRGKNGRRRIVISTNIAETSVTVPGIKYVVDSGLKNEKRYNKNSGLESMTEVPVSQAESSQRAGRAGRLQEGEWHACFSQEDYELMTSHPDPEILRLDIAETVLKVLAMKIPEIERLEFVDQPPKEQIAEAVNKLEMLGAIDNSRMLTEIGELMSRLPLEPRMARVTAEAVSLGCVREALIVGLASKSRNFLRLDQRSQDERSKKPMPWLKNRSELIKQSQSDWEYYLKLFDGYLLTENPRQFCQDYGLDEGTMQKIWDDFSKVIQEINRADFKISSSKEPRAMERSLLSGFAPDHLIRKTKLRHGVEYERVDRADNKIRISSGSVLYDSGVELAVATKLDEGKGSMTVGRGAEQEVLFKYAVGVHGVQPEDLYVAMPTRVRRIPESTSHNFGKTSRSVRTLHKYEFKRADGSWAQLPDQYLPIDSPQATEKLAKLLEEENVSSSLSAQIRENKNILQLLESLNLRSRGQIKWMGLTKWLAEKLATPDLNLAEAKGSEYYRLNLEDICSPDVQKQIEQAAPTSINLHGRSFPVSYQLSRNWQRPEQIESFSAFLKMQISPESEALEFLQTLTDQEMDAVKNQLQVLQPGDKLCLDILLPSLSDYSYFRHEYSGMQNLRDYIQSAFVDKLIKNKDIKPLVAELFYQPGGKLPDLTAAGPVVDLGQIGPFGQAMAAYPYLEPLIDRAFGHEFIEKYKVKYTGRAAALAKNNELAERVASKAREYDMIYLFNEVNQFSFNNLADSAVNELRLGEKFKILRQVSKELPVFDSHFLDTNKFGPDLIPQLLKAYEVILAIKQYAEALDAKKMETEAYLTNPGNTALIQNYSELAGQTGRLFKPSQLELARNKEILTDYWRYRNTSSLASVNQYLESIKQVMAIAEFYNSADTAAKLEDQAARGEVLLNQVVEIKHNGVKAIPNQVLAINPDGTDIAPDIKYEDKWLWRVLPNDSLLVFYSGPQYGGSHGFKSADFKILNPPVKGLSENQTRRLKEFEQAIIAENVGYYNSDGMAIRAGLGNNLPSRQFEGKVRTGTLQDLKPNFLPAPVIEKLDASILTGPTPEYWHDSERLKEAQARLDQLNKIMNWCAGRYKKLADPPNFKVAKDLVAKINMKVSQRSGITEADFTAVEREVDKALNKSLAQLVPGQERTKYTRQIFGYLDALRLELANNQAIKDYVEAGVVTMADMQKKIEALQEEIFEKITNRQALPNPEEFVANLANEI